MRIESIPLSWVRRHCATAVAEGVSLDDLFAEALIAPVHGDDRDRISSPQLALLFYHANLSTEDEGRLNSARGIPLGFGALAAHTLFGYSTLESAINALARLTDMAAGGLRVALRVDHDEAMLVVHCEERRPDSDVGSLEDAHLTFYFMCLNHFLGRPMPLLSVETRDPTHMNLGAAHWATGAPVRLAGLSALRFPKSLLLAPRMAVGRDDMFWDILGPWIDFVERGARPAFGADTPAGVFSVGALARDAGVSPATVRRRLDRTEGGFRQVREKALVAAGLSLLLETGDSVEAVAAELGYSDARSFRRFIKTATGRTPSDWRADGGAGLLRPNPAVHDRIRAFASALDGH